MPQILIITINILSVIALIATGIMVTTYLYNEWCSHLYTKAWEPSYQYKDFLCKKCVKCAKLKYMKMPELIYDGKKQNDAKEDEK